MKGELTDKIRIQHILDAISETEVYLNAVNFEDFLTNSEKRFATIKQIEIVGEACNHLSNELKLRHSEIFLFMNILASICISFGILPKMIFQC